MSDVNVAAIRDALTKATPRPWNLDGPFYWRGGHDSDAAPMVTAGPNRDAVLVMPEDREPRLPTADADAHLIVLLRNNAEALLDALERAQAASEGLDMLVVQAERRGAVEALRNESARFAWAEGDDFYDRFRFIVDLRADEIEDGGEL